MSTEIVCNNSEAIKKIRKINETKIGITFMGKSNTEYLYEIKPEYWSELEDFSKIDGCKGIKRNIDQNMGIKIEKIIIK